MGVVKNRIEAVLLTGGSSQIPSFKDKITHAFEELGAKNAIYDHSPLTAVARGAALYGTRDVIDRHLGMAYALKFALKGSVGGTRPFAHEIVFEKGESLPFEKTFTINPAATLGGQKEMFLEFFEIPENLIARRWVSESNMEFIKQVLRHTDQEVALAGLKVVTLDVAGHTGQDSVDAEDGDTQVRVVFCVDEGGNLTVRYGKQNRVIETGIRLQ